jgi:Zn-dependent peptidase ImmA (M78 family)
MLDAKRKLQIFLAARNLQVWLWSDRYRIWGKTASLQDLVPFPTITVAERHLRIRVEEPEEIGDVDRESDALRVEIGGLIARRERLIKVASKFRLEWRRFTLAHEVGHWLLHPNLTNLREAPLSGGERANSKRSVEEQEADFFAGELLMARKLLKRAVLFNFGGPIDSAHPTLHVAQSLSDGVRRKISTQDLISGGKRFVSLLVAESSSFKLHKPGTFVPLARRFGVSRVAMAIQLEELRWVI